MSAEILREAAKAARDEWAGEVSGPFKNAARIHLAVAKWLDTAAEVADIEEREGWGHGSLTADALTVARAYLGEAS